MALKIGDKVKFLNDTSQGVVTEFVDKKVVKVRTEDGFEIPVLMSELVINNAYFNLNGEEPEPEEDTGSVDSTEDELLAEPEVTYELKNYKGEVLLGIVPDSKQVHNSDLSIYLINDGNYFIQYLISFSQERTSKLVRRGELEPDTKLLIGKYLQSELSKLNAIKIQYFVFDKGAYYSQEPVSNEFDISSIQFYKEQFYRENDYFHEKAIVFSSSVKTVSEELHDISAEELRNAMLEKKDIKNPESRTETVSDSKGIEEVDLHIHEILDDYSGLANGEIVQAQMGRFQTALEGAILNKVPRIVFIHGVGNGKLKYELRKALDTKYSEYQYQDASFREYGYGATMVLLHKK